MAPGAGAGTCAWLPADAVHSSTRVKRVVRKADSIGLHSGVGEFILQSGRRSKIFAAKRHPK